ncbi:Derlin-2 [Smittium mucronatum]|uniref:Derlin n=1 Tax=Smittium mucronatum TaxID=133383 RepID=A0A1R0GNV6_9FUNG|nr:Derlin-2 [Smittium mucronatum]
MTYFWSRQNPYVMMSFLGILNFSAPYLPWVMMGVSTVINNKIPQNDLIGIVLGHILWFFEEEWPRRPESNGFRLLKAPEFIHRIFNNGFNINYFNVEQQPIFNDVPLNRPLPTNPTIPSHESAAPSSSHQPLVPEKEKTASHPHLDEKSSLDSEPATIDHTQSNPKAPESDIEKLDFPTAIDSSKLGADGLRHRNPHN